MVDPSRIFLWAWDARPYPHFPALGATWADGVNYERGHWLNGRIGAVPLGALILSVCASYGFTDVEVGGVEGLVDGFVIDRGMSVRDALEGLMSAFGIDVVESGGSLRFSMRSRAAAISAVVEELVETAADQPLYALTRAQETELPATVKLGYVESGLDYRNAAVEARRLGGSSLRDVRLDLPCAVDQAQAQIRAEVGLQESWAARHSAELTLPPSAYQIEAGDVLLLALGGGPLALRIEEISDGAARKLRARSYDADVFVPPETASRALAVGVAKVFGKPDAVIMDLPIATALALPHAPWLAASAKPWPGSLAVYRKTGTAAFSFNRLIEAQATKGVLVETFAAGPLHIFDRSTVLTVKLDRGALVSVSDEELLQGANACAVGSLATGWELLQFGAAELVATRTYRLTHLLRGQSGSEPEMLLSRAIGERFVLLNGAVVQPILSVGEAALANTWRIGPVQYDIGRSYASISHQSRMLGLRPLSPCQLRARRDGADVVFNWLRRTRVDGDSWELDEVPLAEELETYAIGILDGSTLKRSASTDISEYRYTAAAIAEDFGTDPGLFTLRIAQLSATFGPGANLQRTIHV